MPSIIGIDFLKYFTILFDEDVVYLKKNVFIIKK